MFRDAFNQVSGIRWFRIENLFARVFRPTFVLFVFEIKNTVCLVVKLSGGLLLRVIRLIGILVL